MPSEGAQVPSGDDVRDHGQREAARRRRRHPNNVPPPVVDFDGRAPNRAILTEVLRCQEPAVIAHRTRDPSSNRAVIKAHRPFGSDASKHPSELWIAPRRTDDRGRAIGQKQLSRCRIAGEAFARARDRLDEGRVDNEAPIGEVDGRAHELGPRLVTRAELVPSLPEPRDGAGRAGRTPPVS